MREHALLLHVEVGLTAQLVLTLNQLLAILFEADLILRQLDLLRPSRRVVSYHAVVLGSEVLLERLQIPHHLLPRFQLVSRKLYLGLRFLSDWLDLSCGCFEPLTLLREEKGALALLLATTSEEGRGLRSRRKGLSSACFFFFSFFILNIPLLGSFGHLGNQLLLLRFDPLALAGQDLLVDQVLPHEIPLSHDRSLLLPVGRIIRRR
mmetsp:Transcript_33652/g.51930  ORF Transcript_33652/g.51930 Transcript_33652/m.51930 type:complete len:207 (-) Transcript_33652:697-1317(-)